MAKADFFKNISNIIQNNEKRLSYGVSVTDFDKDGNLNISGASLTLDDSGTNLIPDYYDGANSK